MRKFLTFLFATCLTVGAWALQKPLPSLHVEGKWLVDTYGNHVVLHGVMDTPSMWFNSNRWQGGYNEQGAINCRAYFNKLFDGMHQANCDVFRLHLDFIRLIIEFAEFGYPVHKERDLLAELRSDVLMDKDVSSTTS